MGGALHTICTRSVQTVTRVLMACQASMMRHTERTLYTIGRQRRERGYLGVDLPEDDWIDAVERTDARAVVIGSVMRLTRSLRLTGDVRDEVGALAASLTTTAPAPPGAR